MTRTTMTRVADGREILYFDDAGCHSLPAAPRDGHCELPARPEPGQPAFRRAQPRMGRRRRAPAVTHAPAARGPVPHLPDDAGQQDRDSGTGLRRRRL